MCEQVGTIQEWTPNSLQKITTETRIVSWREDAK